MRALWTIAILLLGPVAGAIGGRKLSAVPSRRLIYMSNGLNLVVLGAITAAVDMTHGSAALGLLVSARDVRTLCLWSAAIAVTCIAVVALTLLLRLALRRSPKSSVLALLPRGGADDKNKLGKQIGRTHDDLMKKLPLKITLIALSSVCFMSCAEETKSVRPGGTTSTVVPAGKTYVMLDAKGKVIARLGPGKRLPTGCHEIDCPPGHALSDVCFQCLQVAPPPPQ